jgi:hypothetical protein
MIGTEVRDALTGRALRRRAPQPNLVFDSTLTSLATGAFDFASLFLACKIGGSSAVNSLPSNTVSFTQIGTALTASASFFTGAMNGAILKFGVGPFTGGSGLTATALSGSGIGLQVDVVVATAPDDPWDGNYNKKGVVSVVPHAGNTGSLFTVGDLLTFTDATGSSWLGKVSGGGSGGSVKAITDATEQYLSSASGLTAVGSLTQTFTTALYGTVWYVAQTALTTPLTTLSGGCRSTTFVTGPGACGTSFPGGATSSQITLKRTYQFPVQSAPFSVSEIGYSDNTNNDGSCNGRIVLALPDNVAVTEYYVVQISITYTLTPNVPSPQANVATGFSVNGQIMWNNWDCRIVQSNGTTASYQDSSYNTMDGSPPMVTFGIVTAPALNAHISQGTVPLVGITYGSAPGAAYSNSGLPVGVATTRVSFSWSTAGETVYSIFFFHGGNYSFSSPVFCCNLTTPFTLPTGTFVGYIDFQRVVTRSLAN